MQVESGGGRNKLFDTFLDDQEILTPFYVHNIDNICYYTKYILNCQAG